MSSRTRITGLSVAFLLVVPLAVLAAWTPSEKEADAYNDAIEDVRDGIDEWRDGDDLDRATKIVLKFAKKDLGRALRKFGEEPEWNKVVRSLEAMKDGVRLLKIARKLDRDSDFRDFIDESMEALYDQSRELALSASGHVLDNYDSSSKKAVRRLLKAGAKTEQAEDRADEGRYAGGIKANAKAILKLAKGGLLD